MSETFYTYCPHRTGNPMGCGACKPERELRERLAKAEKERDEYKGKCLDYARFSGDTIGSLRAENARLREVLALISREALAATKEPA